MKKLVKVIIIMIIGAYIFTHTEPGKKFLEWIGNTKTLTKEDVNDLYDKGTVIIDGAGNIINGAAKKVEDIYNAQRSK